MDEQQELQELLATQAQYQKPPRGEPASPTQSKQDMSEHCQWEKAPNGIFVATGTTQPHLPTGAYTVDMTDTGRILFNSKKILTDALIDLGESNSLHVIAGIRLFWTRKGCRLHI